MTATAAFGWGSSHLTAMPAGEVDLEKPAERLAVHQTLARYAFALDHGDLMALEGVLTKDTTWTASQPAFRAYHSQQITCGPCDVIRNRVCWQIRC
ncbi:hypothetical protein ACU639_00675 [Streptomyces cynarae]|uniref:hypothetical protein n=1 Tax=Streptomyces cynarae TaxID=2981134 RepID=UPI00406C6AFE